MDRAPLSREPRVAPAELISGLSAFATRICAPAMRWHPFVSWPTRAKLLNHIRFSSQARRTLPMASCDLGPCTDGFR